jgi:hypothetical protein
MGDSIRQISAIFEGCDPRTLTIAAINALLIAMCAGLFPVANYGDFVAHPNAVGRN